MLFYLFIALFIIAMSAAWGANFFGLPGNWVMLVLAIGWFLLTDSADTSHIGWPILLVILALALIGELLEFLASVFGTKRAGGERKAAVGGVIGSLVGSVVGAVFGLPIPIPVVGVIIGSVLFACIGAMVGATIGEKWHGSKLDRSLKVGSAAFVGRLFGTLGKIAMGSVILVIALVSLLL